MSDSVKLKAFAKINLGLDVIRRRDDGYHEVRMIMQSIRLFDRITMTRNSSGTIQLSSNLHFLPLRENNLVYQAIKEVREIYSIPDGVDVHLEKHIPISAGLAGGSSDAAAILVGMNQLFSLNLPEKRLREIGLTMGADIPFCIMRGTALSEGIGEILTPLPPMPDCFIVIVKPSFSMSTAFVYQNLDLTRVEHPDIDGMIRALGQKDLSGITDRMGNVLEQVTATHFPEIISIREKLIELGAKNAIMSGSGSSVFGIFDDEDAAERAASYFRKQPDIKLSRNVTAYNRPL